MSGLTSSGTDDSVYLKLMNSGSDEQCKTNVLDSAGNSWATGTWDTYTNKYEELDPCKGFYPAEGNLLFTFEMSGNDALSLDSLIVEFGNKVFSWSGQQWFENEDEWRSLN